MGTFDNAYFEERERWASQVADNSARMAWAQGKCTSHGWGEFVIPDPIMFGIAFVHEPTMAYGCVLDDDGQLVDGRFPRAGGGVAHWIQDGQDYYVGATVFITVATADPILAAVDARNNALAPTGDDLEKYVEDPGYDLTHHFTFNALAIKDMQP